MPLKSVETPKYLKRTRIFVDSKDKIADRSKGPFDYVVRVADPFQNVVGIELVEWNLHGFLSSTFLGRYNSRLPGQSSYDTVRSQIPGASTFDVELEDETGTIFLTVDVNMEEAIGDLSTCGMVLLNDAFFLPALEGAFNNRLAVVGNATFNTGNVTIDFSVADSGVLQLVAFRTGTNVPLRTRLLFKTGPGAADGAARALGFVEGVDTPRVLALSSTPGIGSGSNYTTLGTYFYNYQPWRYINVYVDEVKSNFEPLERIYIKRIRNPKYRQPCNKDHNLRLLSEPVRRLDQLSIRLTLDDDHRIADFLDTGHQLTFDVVTLAQETTIPHWVQQKITL